MNADVALIAAAAVFAVAAVANWWSRWRDDARLELISKPLATIAAIGMAIAAGADSSRMTVWLVIALTLCLAGDVLLLPRVNRFTFGLAAFLLGHLAFVGAFAVDGIDQVRLMGPALVGCGLSAAFWGVPIMKGARAVQMLRPVQAYLVIISLMCVVGWGTGNWLTMCGAAAFVASDTVLGWQQFVTQAKWRRLAIMITYHAAIALLALSPLA